METTTEEKNFATLMHLGSLSQVIIPLGNLIVPAIMWSSRKKDSQFIENNGKNIINFQLSIFFYSLMILLVGTVAAIVTFFSIINSNKFVFTEDYFETQFGSGNLTSLTLFLIFACFMWAFSKLLEFAIIIYASVKASNGEVYKYPLTINFLK